MHERFETRKLVEMPVEVLSTGSDLPMEFFTWDFSPRGAYFASDATPRIGEKIICSFRLDDSSETFCFYGEIKRINRGRREFDCGPVGFGVEFLDTTPFERLKIRRAIKELPLALLSPCRDKPVTV